MKSPVPKKMIHVAAATGLMLLCAAEVSAQRPGHGGAILLAQQSGARSQAQVAKRQGDELLRAGKHGQAEQAYRQAAKLDPSWYEPLEAIGNILFSQGKYVKAAETFKRAVALEPKYHTGLYNIAYAYRKAGRYQQAAEFYQKYLAAKPDDPDGYYGLAATYEAMGKWAQARKNYLLYAERETRPSERRYVIKARDKAQMLAKKMGLQPPQPAAAPKTAAPAKPVTRPATTTAAKATAEAPASPAAASPAAAKPATAEAATAKPAAARPAAAPAASPPAPGRPAVQKPADAEKVAQLLRSGDQAMAAKSYSKALADYFAAVRLDGSNTEALFKLGNVYAATGNRKAAELKWRKVLQIDPAHQGARAALEKSQKPAATAAESTARPARTAGSQQAQATAARPAMAARPTLSPGESAPSKTTGESPAATKTAAATAKPKAGAAAAGRAKPPATPAAAQGQVSRLLAAGDDFFKQKSFARAIDSYGKAARLAPRNEEALFKLGMAYALAGNYQVAIYKWQQVLELNPNNKSARRNVERAKRLLAQQGAVAAKPAPAKPSLEQVRALLAAGKAKRALAMVESWLRSRSRDPEALLLKGRALLLLKEYGKAKRAFSQAMVADPARAEPFFGLGEACRLSGDQDRARYYYRMYLRSRAADLDPDKVKQAQRYLGG